MPEEQLGKAFQSAEEARTIEIYKNVSDAVVFISTLTLTVDPFDFFPEVKPTEGSGSG